MEETVLIVEDDPDIVEILTLYLSGAGYYVESACDGAKAIELLSPDRHTIMLVDLMMPNMNGFEFIKKARAITTAPIVIISARSQATDKMLALDLGADGYITKPFDPIEVIAYVRAMIRRASIFNDNRKNASPNIIQIGNIKLDNEKLIVSKDDEPVMLTASEFKILLKLMSSPGRVFTKEELYEVVVGDFYTGGSESITVHISNIRSKLENNPVHPEFILTVRGLGYKFAN